MATTIDWGTKIITVEQADMVQTQTSPPIDIYQLNVNDLHEDLRLLEASALGMANVRTHTYRAPVTLSGVTYARLMEIINGYTVEFSPDGSTTPYVVQVVGGNSNVGDVIRPQPGVSVQVANSAGLQDAESLQAASFANAVSIDTTSSFSGTTFPVGTRQNPVNNVADAISIAEARGINHLNIVRSMTLNSGDFSDGYIFEADNPNVVTITLDPATNVTNCTFHNVTVTGTLDGNNELIRCTAYDITYVNGSIYETALSGTITLGGSTQASLFDCWSAVAGGGPTQLVTIDMGGSGQDLAVRNFTGGLKLINGTGTLDASLDFTSGRIVIDSTITAGSYTLRGDAIVTDNSGGTATVLNNTIHEAIEASAFFGHVTVDEDNTTGAAISGTEFPAGTDEAPALLISQAMEIARERGLVEMRVIGPATVLATDNIQGMTLFCRLVGSSVDLTAVGAEVNRTAFVNLAVFGTLEERSSFKDCFVFNATFLRARLTGCGLSQTVTLSGGGTSVLERCYSGYPLGQNNTSPAEVTIDMGGTGQSLRMVSWSGNATITNLTDAAEYVEIDSNSGVITIDSTVTAGTIRVRGWCDIVDNSGGTTVVTVDTDRSKLCKVADRIDADHDIITTAGELIVTKANTATELDRYDLEDTDGATFDPTGTKGIGKRTRQ